MNILVVVPKYLNNNNIDYTYMFPLGLAYISSVLKQGGHYVDCCNLNHDTGTVSSLLNERLTKKKYDYICTGGLSVHYRQIKKICEALRNSGTSTGLILGGGLISSEPELMFNALNPDYIIIGEGESTTQELIACLENKHNIENVNGIGYRDKNGKIVLAPGRKAIANLDCLPWPDFDGFEFATVLNHMRPTDLFFYDLYDFPRVYPVIASRSCPYQCTFCYHPIGNKYRQRSIDSVIQELETNVRKYRINIIAIYDELFSHDRERVYEFCNRFKKLQEKISWEIKWTCQMRVVGLDEDLLKTMKNAGCFMVSYGFESYNQVVLNSMKKHVTAEQIDNAIKWTLKNSISIQANFLFGDRVETVQTAHETLGYWKDNIHAGIQLVFINPYPGTALYKYCLERGVIKDKLDFIENHILDAINMTDEMTDIEFEKLKLDIFEGELKYRVCAIPISLKKVKDSGTYNIRVKCPHCNENVEYGNYTIGHRSFFNLMMYCRQCRRRFFLVSRLYKYVTKVYLLLTPLMSRRMKIVAPNARHCVRNMRDNLSRWAKNIFK